MICEHFLLTLIGYKRFTDSINLPLLDSHCSVEDQWILFNETEKSKAEEK